MPSDRLRSSKERPRVGLPIVDSLSVDHSPSRRGSHSEIAGR